MLKLNAIIGTNDTIFHIDSSYKNVLKVKQPLQIEVTNIYYQIIDSSMDEVLKSMTNFFWSREGRLLLMMMVMMISSNHARIWKIIWNSKSKGWSTSATTGWMIDQMIRIFVTETDYMLFQSHMSCDMTWNPLSNVICDMWHGDGDSEFMGIGSLSDRNSEMSNRLRIGTRSIMITYSDNREKAKTNATVNTYSIVNRKISETIALIYSPHIIKTT